MDLFLRVSVRSLLAPGNADDVARAHPARLSIVTTRKDAGRIRSSPSFVRLASTLPVDFSLVGPLEHKISANDAAVPRIRYGDQEPRSIAAVGGKY